MVTCETRTHNTCNMYNKDIFVREEELFVIGKGPDVSLNAGYKRYIGRVAHTWVIL